MKIGCDACGLAEAAVLCCADEAALCRRCDAAVHSANRLAGRHRRVALLPASAGGDDPCRPVCDICQDKTGYIFCLDDRALLCRTCDVAVHSGGAHVSSHRRFLLTGVRVGSEEIHDVPGSDGATGAISPSTSCGGNVVPSSGNPTIIPDAVPAAAKDGFGRQQWQWSEFLADDIGSSMEQCYHGVSEPGSFSLSS